MKNVISTILVTCIVISCTYSQKIKGDFLYVERLVKSKYEQKEAVLDMAIKTTSTDPFILGNQHHGYEVNSDFYSSNPKFSNNYGTPSYIALLDIKYKDATVNIVKNVSGKFCASISSNIYAVLNLINTDKGLFETEEINFKEINFAYPVENFKNGFDYSKLSNEKKVKTTMVFDNLTEYEANQYRNMNANYAKQVNQQQISKIPVLASEIIEKKFFAYSKSINVYFNYLKPTDEFKSENFNKAYELIQKSIYPVNSEKLFEAIAILKTEKESVVNIEDKKSLKYKIAILENIINCYYAMEKHEDSKSFVDELLVLDIKNDIANSVLKRIANPIKSQTFQEFVYKSIPGEYEKTDLKRFLTKKSNQVNELLTTDGLYNSYFYLYLNNYKNCCKIFEKTNNFVKIDNDIMDYLAETLIMSKSSLRKMANNADENLVDFKNFVTKVNEEIAPLESKKKHFDYFNASNDLYRSEVRLVLFKKFKRSDFMFKEQIEIALAKSFAKLSDTEKQNVTLIHDVYSKLIITAIEGNYDNKKVLLNQIDQIKEIFFKKQKDRLPEEYFEFENIINRTNTDKSFSAQELNNLGILFANIYNIFLL